VFKFQLAYLIVKFNYLQMAFIVAIILCLSSNVGSKLLLSLLLSVLGLSLFRQTLTEFLFNDSYLLRLDYFFLYFSENICLPLVFAAIGKCIWTC